MTPIMQICRPLTQPLRRHEAGSGLVAIIVALGIAAIAVAICMQQFANKMLELRMAQEAGQLEDIRDFIRGTLACAQTVAAAQAADACDGATNVTPKTLDPSGAVEDLADAPVIRFSNGYALRFTCLGDTIDPQIRKFARGTAGGASSDVKMTSAALDGLGPATAGGWHSLFVVAPITCPTASGPP